MHIPTNSGGKVSLFLRQNRMWMREMVLVREIPLSCCSPIILGDLKVSIETQRINLQRTSGNSVIAELPMNHVARPKSFFCASTTWWTKIRKKNIKISAICSNCSWYVFAFFCPLHVVETATKTRHRLAHVLPHNAGTTARLQPGFSVFELGCPTVQNDQTGLVKLKKFQTGCQKPTQIPGSSPCLQLWSPREPVIKSHGAVWKTNARWNF